MSEPQETGTERNEDLVHDGICPVCDEPFTDGFAEVEEGESYEGRICVTEKDADGNDGTMLVHLTGDEEDELSPIEEWERNNEPFSYEPPEKPPHAWSEEEYQELHDRVIRRQTQWICDECTGRGPIGSLRKARRHVEGQHSLDLVDRYALDEDDLEPATDGGQEITAQERAEENHGLGDFSGGGRVD